MPVSRRERIVIAAEAWLRAHDALTAADMAAECNEDMDQQGELNALYDARLRELTLAEKRLIVAIRPPKESPDA